jgi:hypothetical protein
MEEGKHMKTKRSLKLLALLAVLTLVIAACGGGEGGEDETTTTAGTEEPTTTAGEEEPTTTAGEEEPMEPGELGVVEVGAGENVKIGSLQAISGDRPGESDRDRHRRLR